jgi:hypothetical protein
LNGTVNPTRTSATSEPYSHITDVRGSRGA